MALNISSAQSCCNFDRWAYKDFQKQPHFMEMETSHSKKKPRDELGRISV